MRVGSTKKVSALADMLVLIALSLMLHAVYRIWGLNVAELVAGPLLFGLAVLIVLKE